MIDTDSSNLFKRLEYWRQEGLNIAEFIAKYIRDDVITSSKEAYQIGEYLSKLESLHRDIDFATDRLNEVIKEFNAT